MQKFYKMIADADAQGDADALLVDAIGHVQPRDVGKLAFLTGEAFDVCQVESDEQRAARLARSGECVAYGLKYAQRRYYCPACRVSAMVGTNHTGEIYSTCQYCDGSPLYCADVEPFAGLNYVEALFTFYKLDTEKDADKREYERIKREQLAQGRKVWTISPRRFPLLYIMRHVEALKARDGQSVRLYKPETFEDQFISDAGRLHSWAEVQYPRRASKDGYFLTLPAPLNTRAS